MDAPYRLIAPPPLHAQSSAPPLYAQSQPSAPPFYTQPQSPAPPLHIQSKPSAPPLYAQPQSPAPQVVYVTGADGRRYPFHHVSGRYFPAFDTARYPFVPAAASDRPQAQHEATLPPSPPTPPPPSSPSLPPHEPQQQPPPAQSRPYLTCRLRPRTDADARRPASDPTATSTTRQPMLRRSVFAPIAAPTAAEPPPPPPPPPPAHPPDDAQAPSDSAAPAPTALADCGESWRIAAHDYLGSSERLVALVFHHPTSQSLVHALASALLPHPSCSACLAPGVADEATQLVFTPVESVAGDEGPWRACVFSCGGDVPFGRVVPLPRADGQQGASTALWNCTLPPLAPDQHALCRRLVYDATREALLFALRERRAAEPPEIRHAWRVVLPIPAPTHTELHGDVCAGVKLAVEHVLLRPPLTPQTVGEHRSEFRALVDDSQPAPPGQQN